MYEKHFGFIEKPFELTPDPTFLYLSSETRETIATLKVCIIERRGFLLLVGEPGTGKTTLINTLLDMPDERTKFAYVFNPAFDFQDLLQTVLNEFDLAEEDEVIPKRKAIRRLNQYVIDRYEKGKTTAIIIDEAQYLDITTLENLRLLSNLETRKHKLLQIIIAGQPEIESTLRNPNLRQLTQRIGLRRRTKPLNEKDCFEYIRHRLKVAGYYGPRLFANRAKYLIFEYSRGIPRTINILCDSALLIAYATHKKRIDSFIVKEAIEDIQIVDVDTDKNTENKLKETEKSSYSVISADQTEPSTDKRQAHPEDEQSQAEKEPTRLINDQEIADIIDSKTTDQDVTTKNIEISEPGKQSRKILFSRASTSILVAMLFLNLSAVAFYFWGKERYQQSVNPQSEQTVVETPVIENDRARALDSEAEYSVVETLDAKLERLYHKIEDMKLALEDQAKKNQDRQDEINTTIGEKLKKSQENQPGADLIHNDFVSITGVEHKQANANEDAINESVTHTKYLLIKKGDSLNEIIIREYGSLDEKIVSMVLKNNLEVSNPDIILENQIIKLPLMINTKSAREINNENR